MWEILSGMQKMRNLADIAPTQDSRAPLVSIIVPACNEENAVESGLRTLLAQEYPNMEIIVIDDRSTDGTFAVLTKLQTEFPELKVERIQELPAGWLGKNHALFRGAEKAKGEILLFTDADILMQPSTLSRAVNYLLAEKLDHLSLVFQNISDGGLLNAMIIDALGGLFFLLKPWNVRKPGNRSFIGVGAFNMIGRNAYREIGGHAALKMHPIDDIMLGKKVKQHGFSQDCLLGTSFVRVRWYESVPALIEGLMKNVFALYNYNTVLAVAAILGIISLTILPLWGAVCLSGVARSFFAASLFCRFTLFFAHAGEMGIPACQVGWSLLTPYLTCYIIARAVCKTLKNKGIQWRGTRYSLHELKEQEPLLDFSPWKRVKE